MVCGQANMPEQVMLISKHCVHLLWSFVWARTVQQPLRDSHLSAAANQRKHAVVCVLTLAFVRSQLIMAAQNNDIECLRQLVRY
jgi:hypothetical protein